MRSTTTRCSTSWARCCRRPAWNVSFVTTTPADSAGRTWRIACCGTSTKGRLRNIWRNALEGWRRRSRIRRCWSSGGPGSASAGWCRRPSRASCAAAPLALLKLDFINGSAHTFVPGRARTRLEAVEAGRALPVVQHGSPHGQKHELAWVTPGHALFEAIRRHAREQALEPLACGATFHSLAHDAPARIDFYRARVVDGFGHVIHERIFAVELPGDDELRRCESGVLGDLTVPPFRIHCRRSPTAGTGGVAFGNTPLCRFSRRRARSVSWKSLVLRITSKSRSRSFCSGPTMGSGGRPATWTRGRQGAEGRLTMAEARHAELLARRERWREELEQQQALYGGGRRTSGAWPMKRWVSANPVEREATPAKAAQRWRRSWPFTMLPRGAGSCGPERGICLHSADTTAIAYPAKPCKLLIVFEPASGLEPLTC